MKRTELCSETERTGEALSPLRVIRHYVKWQGDQLNASCHLCFVGAHSVNHAFDLVKVSLDRRRDAFMQYEIYPATESRVN